MEKRKIGRSPLEVSAVGLGLMSMSGIYGNANDEESISLIHYALDKGINLLDSADMYGWGHNEQLLGRALKGWRDKAIVATKFGQTKDASGKQGVDGRPEYVMQACEASLKRLGIDVIDPYAPLGRSMLTGTVHGKADVPEGDRRLQHPRFQGENLDRNVQLVSRLESIAREKKCTPAQLVLAWLLAQGSDIVPIPGTKRKQRVDENCAALDIKLSKEDVKRISDAAPAGAGAGTRYPADAMKRVYL